MRYVGRFAPSPTGPLHLGSLLTAAASYLDTRQHHGEWLVRIEDIDPPREVPGAADAILHALERLDLEWDRDVLYQSRRVPAYRDMAEQLRRDGLAYPCSCTRSMLRAASPDKSHAPRYPGTCRDQTRHPRATALRLRAPSEPVRFDDRVQGPQVHDLAATSGDYVIFRRDGLPAYHLAVVADDAHQGVTHVLRGTDLLASTASHIHLQRTLSLPIPHYGHVPVIVNAAGQKLSKQTGAAALGLDRPGLAALEVLRHLGLAPPPELHGAPPRELWNWAEPRWNPGLLAGVRTVQHRDIAVDPPLV